MVAPSSLTVTLVMNRGPSSRGSQSSIRGEGDSFLLELQPIKRGHQASFYWLQLKNSGAALYCHLGQLDQGLTML